MSREVSRYQHTKARKIADMLLAQKTTLSRFELAKVMSLANDDQWRQIAFAADQPLADIECKMLVLAKLRQKAPRLVAK